MSDCNKLTAKFEEQKMFSADFGKVGQPGPQGPAGATFRPSLNSSGDLSWTNDRGLDNPEPVNIMGPQGKDGSPGPQGPPGDNTAALEAAQVATDAAAKANALVPDVEQLKNDLANKLPKSPTDWEQWTADEQAAAREQIHGSFRKIIDVTLEEDVTAGITFEYDAVGNEINAQDICIYVYLPEDYTKNGVNFRVGLTIGDVYIDSFRSFNSGGMLNRYIRYMMFSIGELRIPVHSTPTPNVGYVNGYPATIASSFSVIPGSVSKIFIELHGGMLPAGSKIEIYAR